VPKISPHRETIRKSIAQILELDETAVSVKATTSDAMGFTGREEGIAAIAVVLIQR
jgi:2-C-methyl-D-erythritol 2,4-cyclodiphosphate synthase